MQQNEGRQRPRGVIIIAIIMAILGILSILPPLLESQFFLHSAAFRNNSVLISNLIPTFIVGGITTVIKLVVAWGLWTLKAWAFWTAAVVEAIQLIISLLHWLILYNASFNLIVAIDILSVVIAAVILAFLFADPDVRAAFRT